MQPAGGTHVQVARVQLHLLLQLGQQLVVEGLELRDATKPQPVSSAATPLDNSQNSKEAARLWRSMQTAPEQRLLVTEHDLEPGENYSLPTSNSSSLFRRQKKDFDCSQTSDDRVISRQLVINADKHVV